MRHHHLSEQREHGQGLVEYALILVFTSIAVMGVLSLVGPVVADVFCDVTSSLGSNVDCEPAEAEASPAGEDTAGENTTSHEPPPRPGEESSGSGSGEGSGSRS